MEQREKLGSRLGFILLSAGCAIGIGNVWKFPYMTGQNGGGMFVLLYLFFLIIMGVPMMTVEFAIGRASQKSPLLACKSLQKPKQKWHIHGYLALIGNYLLMMFYTAVTGWMLNYFYLSAKGTFVNTNNEMIDKTYSNMLSDPLTMAFWMIAVVIIGFSVCSLGVQKGVEKVTKVMMIALLGIIVVLAINSITLEGGKEGLKFYLMPSIDNMVKNGIGSTVVSAMNQAFFTLSLGIGAMAIFGSYIGKERALAGEAVIVAVLDTFVAVTAGLIIFPACSAYGAEYDSGPDLLFKTLPRIFNNMAGGRFWGSLFFLFMTFAAFSTIIAVFETIISCSMELTGCSRKKASVVNIFLMIILSLPCVLGFNLLSGIQPFGEGSVIMDLEDFIVSNIALPLGAIICLFFCTSKKGWGWKNFVAEANTGKGLKISDKLRIYMSYILPIIIMIIFVIGIYEKLSPIVLGWFN